MQHKRHKMIYIISGIFGILIVFFMIKGCSYPTSYRALIPKALDSAYKEYDRLCKEEIGKVLYARPAGNIEKKMFLLSGDIKISDVISVIQGFVVDGDDNIIYMYIQGFKYYNSWATPSLSMHQDVKQHIQCKPFEDSKEEYAIIKEIAFKNKEYIGDEMIIKEMRRINKMDYASSQKYISQVFKEAINVKNSHYISIKENPNDPQQ